MRYFSLKPNVLLRGWSDIKHGLININNGSVVYLTKAAMNAVELAMNGIDADSYIIFPVYRQVLEQLVDIGAAVFTDTFIEPDPIQKFKTALNCYTSSVHWSITGRCNMKCRHCFVEAPDAFYGELSLKECINIMDQMTEANIYTVSLTGGEPLVRSDFMDFYKALKDRRIGVERIYTNGLLVTDRWLESFKTAEPRKILFSLSFDGVGHHDWVRGRDGMEKMVIDTVKRLIKSGYSVEIETALFKDNISSMAETCRLLAELGVKIWKISPMKASGAWIKYAAEHDARPEEIYNSYLDIIKTFEGLGKPFTLQLGAVYVYDFRNKTARPLVNTCSNCSEKSLDNPVCSCMKLHPYLLPNGTLMPCMPLSNCGLDEKMPNLLNIPINKVLSKDSEFFKSISLTAREMFEQYPSQCSNCEFRFQCRGGCRALAYDSGNLYGPDKEMCRYFKGGIKEMFEPYYTKISQPCSVKTDK